MFSHLRGCLMVSPLEIFRISFRFILIPNKYLNPYSCPQRPQMLILFIQMIAGGYVLFIHCSYQFSWSSVMKPQGSCQVFSSLVNNHKCFSCSCLLMLFQRQLRTFERCAQVIFLNLFSCLLLLVSTELRDKMMLLFYLHSSCLQTSTR